jgi:hypothetical protein
VGDCLASLRIMCRVSGCGMWLLLMMRRLRCVRRIFLVSRCGPLIRLRRPLLIVRPLVLPLWCA